MKNNKKKKKRKENHKSKSAKGLEFLLPMKFPAAAIERGENRREQRERQRDLEKQRKERGLLVNMNPSRF